METFIYEVLVAFINKRESDTPCPILNMTINRASMIIGLVSHVSEK
jgi:hypothetical protein